MAAKPAATPAQPTTAAAATSEGAQGPAALDPDSAQNQQDHKLAFLNQRVSREIYSPQSLQTPRSPYQIMAGTLDRRGPGHWP